MKDSLLLELTQALSEGLARRHHFWTALVIVVALLIAALAARLTRRRVADRLRGTREREGRPPDALQFSIDGVRRLMFPVTAQIVLWLGEGVLRLTGIFREAGDERLLRLAMTLLGAMAVVRLVVYVLRRVFRRMTWIAPFERALALVIWLAVALYITGLSGEVGDWLDTHALPLGSHHLALSTLLAGTSSVIVTMLLALWLGSAIDARLMGAHTLDNNLRVVLSRVVRALLLVIAVLAALSVVGIDLTVLSVFGGALGVGLGLGLQRIASNYVSGFIILLDRSLRIGDIIGVDKYFGEVSEIKTRYTVLHSLDGTEAILPNEMLVSTPVINYSYNNRLMRASVKVTVDYETDLAAAMTLMCDAARVHPRVLADPAPGTAVLNLAADGVEIEVGFWIADPELGRGGVQSDVAVELLKRLRAAGVKIPSAQREIKIQGGPATLLATGFPMSSANSSTGAAAPTPRQAQEALVPHSAPPTP